MLNPLILKKSNLKKRKIKRKKVKIMPKKRPKKDTKEGLIYRATQDARARYVIDKKLKEENMWVHYVLQSLLATFTLFVVLLVLRFNTPLIIAALGSSAFIVFAMPKNITAQPRNVIGGHFVGIISGSICASLLLVFGSDPELILILAAASSVGLSIFIMVVTDTEHPPAGSTALAFVLHVGEAGDLIAFTLVILVSAVIISGVKHVLNPKLKDLV
jgi:CBS-domain-containing membrane protein